MECAPLWLWYSLALSCTAWICYTDVRSFWIPDCPVVLLALGNGLAWYAQLVRPTWTISLGVAAFFLFLYLFWPQSIGSGDIKLALALSPGCPAWGAWAMLISSFFLAALTALALWRWQGKKVLPFGPFLLLGWWLAREPLLPLWPFGSIW